MLVEIYLCYQLSVANFINHNINSIQFLGTIYLSKKVTKVYV